MQIVVSKHQTILLVTSFLFAINTQCRSRAHQTAQETEPSTPVGIIALDSSTTLAPSRCKAKGVSTQTRLKRDGDENNTLDAHEDIFPTHVQLGNALYGANGFYVGISINNRAELLHIAHETGQIKLHHTITQANAPEVADDKQGHLWLSTLVSNTERIIHVSPFPFSSSTRIQHSDPSSDSLALLPLSSTEGLIFWDETDPHKLQSSIHTRRVSTNAALKTHPVPKPSSTMDEKSFSFFNKEASEPFVVRHPTRSYAALLWVSEQQKPSSQKIDDESFQQETYRWLEVIMLDLNTGNPVGSPQKVTSMQSHVHTFMATWVEDSLLTITHTEQHASVTDGEEGGEIWLQHHILDRSGLLTTAGRITLAQKHVGSSIPWITASSEPKKALAVYWTLQNKAMSSLLRVEPSKLVVEQSNPEPLLNDRHILANHENIWLSSRLISTAIVWEFFDCH